MPEQELDGVMGELREALKDIPVQYHSEVARALIHDIYVISRAIAVTARTAVIVAGEPDSAA